MSLVVSERSGAEMQGTSGRRGRNEGGREPECGMTGSEGPRSIAERPIRPRGSAGYARDEMQAQNDGKWQASSPLFAILPCRHRSGPGPLDRVCRPV